MKTGYLYNSKYLNHILSYDHPESPERLMALNARIQEIGLDRTVTHLKVVAEDIEDYILTIHTPEHCASIKKIPVTGEVALLAVAGALGAVKAVSEGIVKNAFCALRPPGHHAHNNGTEEGFCFFNNIAIAARFAQIAYQYKKILIIDWDYHHGNGTQDAFYADPSVLFFSTHNWFAYPLTGDPALRGTGEKYGLNLNVHLDNGTDDEMQRAWDEILIPTAEKFKPDIILISAGFDSRKHDVLGTFSITDRCFSILTKQAMILADTYCDGRLVSILEGGYNVEGVALGAAVHLATLATGVVTGNLNTNV